MRSTAAGSRRRRRPRDRRPRRPRRVDPARRRARRRARGRAARARIDDHHDRHLHVRDARPPSMPRRSRVGTMRAHVRADARRARYHRRQLWLGLAGFALGLVYPACVVLASGAAAAPRPRGGGGAHDRWWAQVALVARGARGRAGAAGVPLGCACAASGCRAGSASCTSRSAPGSATAPRRPRSAASLGLAVSLLVYGLLRATAWWWLVAAAAFFVVGIALAALFPVVVMPLFYRAHAARRPGARAPACSRWPSAPASRPSACGSWTSRARAGRPTPPSSGLGRTRRIILFDTLATGFREEEVEAVLAHELAHHVHGDLRRGLVVQGAPHARDVRAGRPAARRRAAALWGLAGAADPPACRGWRWCSSLLGAVQLPLANAFSRRIERQADDFALALHARPRGVHRRHGAARRR